MRRHVLPRRTPRRGKRGGRDLRREDGRPAARLHRRPAGGGRPRHLQRGGRRPWRQDRGHRPQARPAELRRILRAAAVHAGASRRTSFYLRCRRIQVRRRNLRGSLDARAAELPDGGRRRRRGVQPLRQHGFPRQVAEAPVSRRTAEPAPRVRLRDGVRRLGGVELRRGLRRVSRHCRGRAARCRRQVVQRRAADRRGGRRRRRRTASQEKHVVRLLLAPHSRRPPGAGRRCRQTARGDAGRRLPLALSGRIRGRPLVAESSRHSGGGTRAADGERSRRTACRRRVRRRGLRARASGRFGGARQDRA